MDSNDIGREGERRARRWLWWRGYRILDTNYRVPAGELDIVALRFGTLLVVEVKTLRGRGLRGPGEALTHAKRRRIVAATGAYLRSRRARWRRVEFAVAEVILDARPHLRFIRDAFRADEVAP